MVLDLTVFGEVVGPCPASDVWDVGPAELRGKGHLLHSGRLIRAAT